MAAGGAAVAASLNQPQLAEASDAGTDEETPVD
jgi:hypothetical protein